MTLLEKKMTHLELRLLDSIMEHSVAPSLKDDISSLKTFANTIILHQLLETGRRRTKRNGKLICAKTYSLKVF